MSKVSTKVSKIRFILDGLPSSAKRGYLYCNDCVELNMKPGLSHLDFNTRWSSMFKMIKGKFNSCIALNGVTNCIENFPISVLPRKKEIGPKTLSHSRSCCSADQTPIRTELYQPQLEHNVQ